jgi:YVTN family beta-propeller protein
LLGFRIERVLGRGGMGVVYLAHQIVLERMVALKLLAPELAEDENFRERFLRESRLAASLDHPNIVPVFDAGEVEGRLYIAMRYVEGQDLGRLLDEQGPLDPARALRLLAPIADALDAAHGKGLVHRDVKPSNVLLDQQERPYLADFGLTRQIAEQGLVEQSHFAGSLDYVAPEQIEQQPVGPAADVYSLGCVLHQCLTGRPPYRRGSNLATLFAHLEDAPPTTGSPIDPVLATALAKEPADRYPTCTELVTSARKALGVPEVVVVRDRKPLLLATIGLTLLVAAALAAFFLTRESGPAKPSTKPTLTPRVDSLQRIDPKTNRLAATIGIGRFPSAVAVGAGKVWAGTMDDQNLVRIDPESNQITGAVETGGTEAIAVGGGSVWVSTALATLAQIDPATLTLQSSPNSGYRSVALGAGAIWTVGYDGLVRFNQGGQLGPLVRSMPKVGTDPFVVATGAKAVWVADDATGTVWRVDPATNRVVTTIRLGFDPGGMAFGSGRLWVTNNGRDSLVEIDPLTNRIQRSIRVGNGPVGVGVGEGSVWTANYRDGTVSRIDPSRDSVAATIRVGKDPTEIAAGAGGVWVTVRGA